MKGRPLKLQACRSHPKYWCMECRAPCLGWKCPKHGEKPVFRHSHKLRVPKYKNKARFRKFVEEVQIFFNCVTPEQEELLHIIAKELKLNGKEINGRLL